MKRALTAHSMTYSALCDLHIEAFLKSEKDESGVDYPNMRLATFKTNASCQEGHYSEVEDTIKRS